MTKMRTLAGVIAVIVLLSLIPVSTASAWSGHEHLAMGNRAAVLIDDVVYTITDDVPAPEWMSIKDKGFVVCAEGEGTINCNGCTAWEEAGLDGKTVTIQQAFVFGDGDGSDSGPLGGALDLRTAGRIQLPGKYPAIYFKGKGIITGVEKVSKGIYDLTMELKARTKNGGKLTCSLIAQINIDSGGLVTGQMCTDVMRLWAPVCGEVGPEQN